MRTRSSSNIAGSATLPRTMPALTGIRGWASLWVLLYHVTLFDHVPGLDRGHLGVDAFFMLSGFVLSHGYAPRFEQRGLGALGGFMRGRVARIYPLHLLALAIAVAVVLVLPGFAEARTHDRFSMRAFLACLFLVQNWGVAMPTSWNSPTWSLSAEWFAYLGFPLLAAALVRLRSPRPACAAALGFLALEAAVFLIIGNATPDHLGTLGMFRMACEFAAGSLLWRAAWLGWRLPSWAWSVAILALVVSAFARGGELLSLPAFAILLVEGATAEGVARRVLAHPVSIWLGDISFSLYLLHFIPLDVATWAIKPAIGPTMWIVFQVAFVPLALAVSHVTYFRFELPLKRWLLAPSREIEAVGVAIPPASPEA